MSDSKSGKSEDTPGLIIMPIALTAENGAKASFIGEFHETISTHCVECISYGESHDGDPICEYCNGEGAIQQQVPVSWTTIKAIYDKAVSLYGAPVPTKD
jgi:hypothetical protein